MLTVKEVARLLHVHPNTVRRWSSDGRIKAYRINPRGDRRFKRGEVARFLAKASPSQQISARFRWAGKSASTH
ncbi:MAG: MerR family transcriptional regulator [Dehalococcoidia bacterium]